MTFPYASPAMRDAFLIALDADDRALATQLALNLTGCINPLPGITCSELALPIGSTYGSAALRVVALFGAAIGRVSGSGGATSGSR
jgi:hypothetical protein